MTGAEGVDSSYNRSFFYFINGELYLGGMSYVKVSPNDVIIANNYYESYSNEPV